MTAKQARPADPDTEVEAKPVSGDVLDGKGRMLLSREAILAAEDIAYEYIDVPEWGGTIRVRSLTAADRDAYDAESYGFTSEGKEPTKALTTFRVRRVARGIVDENGDRLFSDADIAAFGAKNASVVDRVDDVIARLSGMDTESVQRALDALKAGPSGGSGTA